MKKKRDAPRELHASKQLHAMIGNDMERFELEETK
jgi:hypothetical protein